MPAHRVPPPTVSDDLQAQAPRQRVPSGPRPLPTRPTAAPPLPPRPPPKDGPPPLPARPDPAQSPVDFAAQQSAPRPRSYDHRDSDASLQPSLSSNRRGWVQPTVETYVNEKPTPKAAPRAWPRRRSNRVWFIVVGVVVLVAIIVGVACGVALHKKSSSSGDSDDDETHPLSASDGGVSVGANGTVPTIGNNSANHFSMSSNRTSYFTRLDPIVDPGAVGAHAHRVFGASYFAQNLSTATEMQKLADCTVAPIQDDKSLYWVPQLYHYYANASYVAYPVNDILIYYHSHAPVGVEIYPFPDNFNMLAGNPNRRVVNFTDPNLNALSWKCDADTTITYGFPTKACERLRQMVIFPSCWDGEEPDDASYTSHLAYPTDGITGYFCPADFPQKLVVVQLEVEFDTSAFPFNGASKTTYVLANGDTSGFGIHGDFANGWKASTFQRFLDECRYMNATDEYGGANNPQNCPALLESYSEEAMYACTPSSKVVDETVGALQPITALPGCNALWQGNVTKPDCPAGHEEGGTLDLVDANTVYEGVGIVI